MDQKRLYEENVGIIRSIAHSVSTSTGIDYYDLESEGNFVFMKCLKNWREEKGVKFSTYLSKTLSLDLYKFVQKERKREKRESEAIEISSKEDFERDMLARITLDSLSRDARMCIDLVLSPPDDMIKMNPCRGMKGKYHERVNKSLVRAYLESKGWKGYQIKSVFEEVRQAIA